MTQPGPLRSFPSLYLYFMKSCYRECAMWEFHGSQLVELGVGARARTEADLKKSGDAVSCASSVPMTLRRPNFDAGPHAPSSCASEGYVLRNGPFRGVPDLT